MPAAFEAMAPMPPQRWSVRLPVDPEYAQLRHIGNLEFARLFQEARLAFNRHLIAQMRSAEHFSDQVIVRIVMDFRAEVFWREEIDIALRVGRIGRSSYDIEIVVREQDRIAVECTTVNVWMSGDRPVPLSPEAVRLLETLM